MSEVIAASVLANGLRTEFADTYTKIRNRQADSRIGKIMDLGIGATNRRHEFGYFEAAPHMEQWRRGSTIPTDGMGSVQFTVPVYNWARRVKWHKDDRKDDQTSSLFEAAKMAGESAALLPERMFFDLIGGTTTTLPAVPLAPDGAAMFATTAGGVARFGISSGNLLTGTGVASTATVLADYYSVLMQFLQFQDGKGQPLLNAGIVDQGLIIVHSAADLDVFEAAFLQKRQGSVLGTDAGVTPSNVVIDASRNVELMASSRLATGDWYAFLRAAPKKATFALDREGLREFQSLEGDNNSDHVRDTGEEYVQWELRMGAGIALPYAAIKVNN